MASLPSTIDLQVIRGDDFSQQFQLLTCDIVSPTSYPNGVISVPTVISGATFTPVNLTGCTILSQIRKTTAFAETLTGSFVVTVDSATTGLFTLSLSNTITTAISSNDNATSRYDVQVTDTAGKVTTYILGEVEITMDVSRP